jgi:hypothetical protein
MHATHQISGMAVRLRQAENRTMAAEAMVEMAKRETSMAVEAAMAYQGEYEQAMARAKDAEEGQRRLLEAASTAYMNVAEAQLSERVISSASSRASSFVSRVTLPVVVEDNEEEEEEDPAWEGSTASKSSKASSKSFKSCRSKSNLDLDEIERHYEEELRMMEDQLRIVQGSLAEALRMKSAGKAREVESDVRFKSLVRVTSAGNGQAIRELEEMKIASERLAEDLKKSQDAIMELQTSLSIEERKRASLEIDLAAAKDEVVALQALSRIHRLGNNSSDQRVQVQSWLAQSAEASSEDGDLNAKRKVEELTKVIASKDKELMKMQRSFDELKRERDAKITNIEEVREEVERKLVIAETDLMEAREYIRELEASPASASVHNQGSSSSLPPAMASPFDLSFSSSNLNNRPTLASGASSSLAPRPSPNHPNLAKVLRHPSLPALSVNQIKNTSHSPDSEVVVDQWFDAATGRRAQGHPPSSVSRDAWGMNGGEGSSGPSGPSGPSGQSATVVSPPPTQHSRVKSLGSESSDSFQSHQPLKAQISTPSILSRGGGGGGEYDSPPTSQSGRVLRPVKSHSSSGAHEMTSARKGSSLNANIHPPQPLEDCDSSPHQLQGGASSSSGGGGFLMGLLDRMSRSPSRPRTHQDRKSPPLHAPLSSVGQQQQQQQQQHSQGDREVEVEEDRGSRMRSRRIPITGPPPMTRHSNSGALTPSMHRSSEGGFLPPVIKPSSSRNDDWVN